MKSRLFASSNGVPMAISGILEWSAYVSLLKQLTSTVESSHAVQLNTCDSKS